MRLFKRNITQGQLDSLFDVIIDMQLSIKQFNEGHHRAAKRMMSLGKRDMFIEMAIVNCQVVEYSIRLIVSSYKAERNIRYVLGKPINDDPVKDMEVIRKAPLGSLIGELKKITGRTSLTKELDYLNNRFRKDFIHHVFFVNDKNLKKVESEAKKYYESGRFVKVASMLIKAGTKIQKRAAKLYLTK